MPSTRLPAAITPVGPPEAEPARRHYPGCVAQGRFGPNEWLVDEIYQQYLADRESVDPAWWDFFADYTPADGSALKAQLDHAAANGHGSPVAAAPATAAPS